MRKCRRDNDGIQGRSGRGRKREESSVVHVECVEEEGGEREERREGGGRGERGRWGGVGVWGGGRVGWRVGGMV